MCFPRLRRDHHKGHTFGILDNLKLPNQFEAIHGRHVDIAQDQVDASLLHARQGFNAITRLEDFFEFLSSLTEGAVDNFPHDRRIAIHGWRSCLSLSFPKRIIRNSDAEQPGVAEFHKLSQTERVRFEHFDQHICLSRLWRRASLRDDQILFACGLCHFWGRGAWHNPAPNVELVRRSHHTHQGCTLCSFPGTILRGQVHYLQPPVGTSQYSLQP